VSRGNQGTRTKHCPRCGGSGEVDISHVDIAICGKCRGNGDVVTVCSRCDRPIAGVDADGLPALFGERDDIQRELEESLPHRHTVGAWCVRLTDALAAIDRCEARGHCDACEAEDKAEEAAE
jgi:ribosomal protein S27AE